MTLKTKNTFIAKNSLKYKIKLVYSVSGSMKQFFS